MKETIVFAAAALALAVVSAALVFFVPGYMYPTLEYRSKVTIDLPREEVWAKFNDETKMKKWLEGLETIDLVSGEKGKPGSRYRLVINGEGEKIELFETMNEVRAPELYHFTLDAEPLVNDVRVTFSERGGRTQMVQEEAVTGKTIGWRALFYWLQSTFKQNAQKNLDNFKNFAEGSKE